VSAVIAQIDKKTLGEAMTDDGLFEMVVKVWLKTKDDVDHRRTSIRPHHDRYNTILDQLSNGLADFKDGGRVKDAHEIILREAAACKVPLDVISKRLMRLFKNPEEADRLESRKCISDGLLIVHCLAASDGKGSSSIFMQEFLKDDMVALTVRLFAFCFEDMVRSREHKRLPDRGPDYIHENLAGLCLRLFWYSLRSKNGAHWACVMLDIGLLQDIACVVSDPQLGKKLTLYLCRIVREIGFRLCHVSVVTAAIKAVSEMTLDGTVERLRCSTLEEVWTNFENTLLERAVYKAFCNPRSVTEEGLNPSTSEFLKLVSITELIRHAPGIIEGLARMRSKAAFVSICFSGISPFINFHSANESEEGGENDTLLKMVETARKSKPKAIAVMEFSYHGAYNCFHLTRLLPKKFLDGSHATDGVSREECATYERRRDLARTPARDEEGKSVPCVLDRIDHVLIDARLNFRPPSPAAPGAKRSSTSLTAPKTIFEYVERKVTAMEWDV